MQPLFFLAIEAHLNLKLGVTILYTEFFSVKNSTPGGWGYYSLHDPWIVMKLKRLASMSNLKKLQG